MAVIAMLLAEITAAATIVLTVVVMAVMHLAMIMVHLAVTTVRLVATMVDRQPPVTGIARLLQKRPRQLNPLRRTSTANMKTLQPVLIAKLSVSSARIM
jgi:hypothetical protein